MLIDEFLLVENPRSIHGSQPIILIIFVKKLDITLHTIMRDLTSEYQILNIKLKLIFNV